MYRELAIDEGGTFTDFVLVNMETGDTIFEKTLKNPKNPVDSIKKGIQKLKLTNLKGLKRITYATTVGSNIMIERNGAKCGLITTKGFRDVYDIGRLSKDEMYNEFYEKHKVLIPRRRRLEIDERINAGGEIIKKIEEEEVVELAKRLIKDGVNSIAVCLLHAYKNPVHEIIVVETIKKNFPDVDISLSHEIANEYREFERTSTTVVNSYISPPLKKHITKMKSFFEEQGFIGTFLIMQANGEATTYEEAIKKSICMLDSGPCVGVAGYERECKFRNIKNVITGDMGGTSFDVGVIVEGNVMRKNSFEVLKHPILMPRVDIVVIGAGGGSIAWIDKGGALNIGPISAGADPGPACYGRGGENPTVTDADLIMGLIDPNFFNGGEIKIYPELAAEALKKKVALPLKQELIEVAVDIFKIINAKMAYAIRTATIEKGLDPKEFTLCCYGGASPIHASSIAAELGICRVIIPQGCANFCAKEIIGSNIGNDFVTSLPPDTYLSDTPYWGKIDLIFEGLLKQGENILKSQSILPEDRFFVKSFDMRYMGQEYSFNIIDSYKKMSLRSADTLRNKFNSMHKREYGFFLNDPIEIVNLRVEAFGKNEVSERKVKFPVNLASTKDAIKNRRKVLISSEAIEYTVFDRTKLSIGSKVEGPAIIEEKTSNTLVLPNDIAEINEFGEIVIEKRYK